MFFDVLSGNSLSRWQLVYFTTLRNDCQQVFWLFSKFFKLFLQKNHFFATARLIYHVLPLLSTVFSKTLKQHFSKTYQNNLYIFPKQTFSQNENISPPFLSRSGFSFCTTQTEIILSENRAQGITRKDCKHYYFIQGRSRNDVFLCWIIKRRRPLKWQRNTKTRLKD